MEVSMAENDELGIDASSAARHSGAGMEGGHRDSVDDKQGR